MSEYIGTNNFQQSRGQDATVQQQHNDNDAMLGKPLTANACLYKELIPVATLLNTIDRWRVNIEEVWLLYLDLLGRVPTCNLIGHK